MDYLTILSEAQAEGIELVPEDTGKSILADFGLSVPPGTRATGPEEALRAAGELGYPVVVKALVPELVHKTDRGGVKLGIRDESELTEAVADLRDRFQDSPVLVEKMEPGGIEFILGLQHDLQFGSCLMIGSGGVLTDLIEDVAFVMLPAGPDEIERALRQLKGFRLLDGFRGRPVCDPEHVVDAAMALARFAMQTAALVQSVDVNPMVVGPKGATALDVKIILKPENGEPEFQAPPPNTGYLERFFTPSSVAVVGASGTPDKIGYVVMDSLLCHEFKGTVYPVTPNREELFGLKCYPSIEALPEKVDLVIMVVDLALIPGMMDACQARDLHAMLIISGGGKELGSERADLEAEISRKAREFSLRVIGPNCIGSFCGSSRFDTFFYTHERVIRPPDGPLAMTAQSGTWGCLFLEAAQELGVHKMVSYGNRVEVDEADLLAHMSGDPETRVLASYIEGLGDGRKYVQTARRIMKESQKPVVVFKAGRSRRGAKAAIGHTGAYGGSYAVYRDVFRQHGVIDTDTFPEFFGSCQALASQPLPAGNRVAMVSNGAGPMICAIDLLGEMGLDLATLGRRHVQMMRDHFPIFYLVENPVDVTGSASAADYAFVIEQFLLDDAVDIIMPWFVFQDTPLDESAPKLIGDLRRQYQKPILGGAAGGPYTQRMSRAMEAEGITMLSDIRAWTAAARALYLWSDTKRRL